MGFIEIASVKSSEELSGIWSDFIDVSKFETSGRLFAFPAEITDGTRIFLGRGQSLIMISDNKISDYIAGAGAFVFHSAFEPYRYTEKSGGSFNAVYAKAPDMFGEHSENAACYVINMPERIKLPFEFSEAAYYDNTCGLEVFLQGSGYFEAGISDALSCFAEAGFYSGEFVRREFLNFSDEEKKGLSAGFENLLRSALSDMREFDIGYDKLVYSTDKIASLINADPQLTQYLPNGAEILGIEFTSIFPDEKSVMEIVKFRRGNGNY